jgi:cell division protein FtsZ
VVARIARELGALTIGVVTKPFAFEGAKRMKNAEQGINELSKEVDALITIPNQRLLEITDEKMSVLEAFQMSDSVLNQGVQGISDLIVMPGLINVDFADVKTIMKNAGTALMGIGLGTGEDRATIAAKAAITSPLLDISIEGATGILFNVIGGEDMGMREVDEAAKIIIEAASPEANIIFGTTIDESMSDQIKITVIATGFETDDIRKRLGIAAPEETRTGAKRDSFAATQQVEEARRRPFRLEDEDEEEEEEEEKEKKDSWGSPSMGDDMEKYDIPAFLRGK